MIHAEGRRVGHEVGMFSVSENEAAAIQRAFHESGEWAAVVELRRHFHIQDNVNALNAVRSIVRWAGAAPPHPQPTSPL
ncbi:hypothetical protein [Azospirillum sp. TSA6c]|uniref:hypothetical protein n=1 Tax=unclassified Azospirillum TaxID=2630922 RepID=UPI000D60BEA1|nr:hypothetical protein [Azospirillum sp. TSA6c]PWC50234.1 hypothetical protein TSA6c_30230 [Azospirillum sp. TSA6c]